jgi:hypothetical protein
MIDGDKLAAILEDIEEKAADGTENDGTDGTTRIVHPVRTTTSEMLDLIADQPTLGSDCENCGKVSACKHVLGHPATITRINCPLWRPKK